jgi:C_GCAxxG_C_C family probable redox protein
VCQEFEIEIENDVIRRIAFGFAGGLGNTGAVCGAVVGAVMAIGLKRGRADTMEEGLR